MDRVQPEPFRLECPLFADELVGSEALQGFEATSEVVSGDEVVAALIFVVFTLSSKKRLRKRIQLLLSELLLSKKFDKK